MSVINTSHESHIPRMISKKTEISPDKALERLEALCAKSERCTEEVRRKLYAWRIGPELSLIHI